MIETRQLKYFLVLADCLHFGKAAEQLHITQPPLTRQIQQLEEKLGVLLFERNKRKVVLTPAGEHFREGVRDIFSRLEKLSDTTRSISEGEAGHLSIGFVSTANYSVLPQIVRKFRQQYPRISLHLEEATGDEQQRKLDSGDLDLGFMFEDFDAAMAGIVVHEEHLVAVVPNNFQLKAQRLQGQSLSTEQFILFPRHRSPSLFNKIIQYCDHVGFSPRVSQEARQMQTIIGLVASELGISIVPDSMQMLGRSDIRFLPLTPAAPRVKTYLVWNPKHLSPALESFLACVDI
ncbi:MAG: LysR family transcriptional regulator [Pseudomonadota bacterium]